MDLKELKSKMDQLSKTAEKMKTEKNSSNVDERFFKATKDSSGNVSCVIRFLPQLDFSKRPYVKKYTHFIKDAGKTFISECPNCGKKEDKCPVCATAKPFWSDYWMYRNKYGNKDHPSCKEVLKSANKFTAQEQAITNILVVKNPADPETEGKVFLYSMPKVVIKKYDQRIMPKDDLDEAVMIHHPLTGRDFKLDGYTKKVSEDIEYINYEDSYFKETSSPISENDEEVLRIINETYDLEAYLNETKIDVDDMTKRFKEFKKFLGMTEEEKKEDKPKEKKEYQEESKDTESSEDEIDEIQIDEIDDFF